MTAKAAAFLLANPLLAASLAQALGQLAGILNAFGLVAVFGGLIGACISALSERHVGGVKTLDAQFAVAPTNRFQRYAFLFPSPLYSSHFRQIVRLCMARSSVL
jgi:hypothetical protein